jgi:hypothetical protein
MTQLIATLTKSNLSKAGTAVFFVSLGAACSGAPESVTHEGDNTAPPPSSCDCRSNENGADGGSTNDGGKKTTDAGDGGNASDGGAYLNPSDVNLGTSGDYVILAQSGISSVSPSVITGDLGVSPAAATYITGFSLIADSTNVFSISTQVTGKVYAADYASPTPANLTTAIGDMQTAFTDAAGRSADVNDLGAGDISGMTLKRGVYKWGTALLMTTDVTLDGSATDVWIFEVAQGLTMASATKVTLSGGAVPKNVFWQFSGAVTLGTTAHMEGIIMAQTSIALLTGASINGRLLAQSAVTLDASTITAP